MSDNDPKPEGSVDQWRLNNARHLAGLTLHFGRFTRWNENWDHDHCAACWAKFAESDEPDVQHEGYTTGPDYRKGAGYEWVRSTCVADLANGLGWKSTSKGRNPG